MTASEAAAQRGGVRRRPRVGGAAAGLRALPAVRVGGLLALALLARGVRGERLLDAREDRRPAARLAGVAPEAVETVEQGLGDREQDRLARRGHVLRLGALPMTLQWMMASFDVSVPLKPYCCAKFLACWAGMWVGSSCRTSLTRLRRTTSTASCRSYSSMIEIPARPSRRVISGRKRAASEAAQARTHKVDVGAGVGRPFDRALRLVDGADSTARRTRS
jgi:hypothetical protein